jgi:tRNA 2-thiocytidine biosynthesis protein TtcA
VSNFVPGSAVAVGPDGATRRRDACLDRLTAKLRRAARRYRLLDEGARIAVGVSGGADSLALAHLLAANNRSLRRPFELVGVHVRLDANGLAAPLPESLLVHLETIGLAVAEVEPEALGEERPLDCFRCARLRRRALLEAALERGCAAVALGHHADDVVETWLLALLFTGKPEVLAPCRRYADGAVTVVRPAYELRRAELRRLLRLVGAPQPTVPCPREADSRRNRVRALLEALGRDERLVRRQLFWAAVRGLPAESDVAASVLP